MDEIADNSLTVNGERLWATLDRSSEIGAAPNGGLNRLALTDEDKEMRDQFRAWAETDGYSVTVDRLGNMFVRRGGMEPGLAPVIIGSHLDSQVNGGRFDGILGVLAGLEVLRSLDDAGIATRRAIEVVNWSNEESVRFHRATLFGSMAFAGQAVVEDVLASTDDDGLTVGAELARIGYAGPSPVGGRVIDANFELHIEQGSKLEAAGIPVGIVTGGCPTALFQIEVAGENAHIGPTPMARRRNALVGASEIVVLLNEIGWRHADTESRATATNIDLMPNKFGIIPHLAKLTVDMRHPDPDVLEAMKAAFVSGIDAAAERSRCTIKAENHLNLGGLTFDTELVDLLRETAARIGAPAMDLLSMAAHDAYAISTIAPAAMIFTPCKDGVTHNEAEDIDPASTLPGVNVLLNAALSRAQR
ncbi:MAG: Zn-dependent hydrolase [Rhodospirillales bacterium]|jgi:N-carbamoyl-L-amino-acid hydrolase|nr:Zn-dependent hydrolase [Rhodospirillales bacterium]MDP6646286.1 Zn-dependent hydrolase [Rhodospirillales bacterium]MDP6842551.1 Zn-dependent hydrolase [Rhodospirillales bacterium]